MRYLRGCPILVLVLACAKEAPPPPPPPPPPPTYMDYAGTWEGAATMTGTETPVPLRLTSTPEGGGWRMLLAGRDSIPMRVSLLGDSLVLLSEPYQSVLRAKVTVQVRTAAVLVDGAMEGKVIATYASPDGQEVVLGTIRATRPAPE